MAREPRTYADAEMFVPAPSAVLPINHCAAAERARCKAIDALRMMVTASVLADLQMRRDPLDDEALDIWLDALRGLQCDVANAVAAYRILRHCSGEG